jgi:tRNA threonylcarbamoyladenosine biosynthesis protein TsaE
MIMVAVRCQSETATDALGRALAEVLSPSTVIAMVGTLGAGKTRLSRAIAEGLGVDPLTVSSPTFVLIHEYEGDLPVYHFDAYRLQSPSQFEALGASDYWDAGGVCLVEWADRVADLLPERSWWITATVEAPGRHRFEVRLPDEEASRLVDRLASVARLSESGLSVD